MPVSNPVQFAVVREDPAVELAVLAELSPLRPRAVLLVASGGCTALTLAAERPDVRVVAIDPNPAQLALVRRKVAALAAGDRAAFGVGRDDPTSLTGCGNFESLFRGLRAVLDDLVLPYDARLRLLTEGGDPSALVGNRYWPVAFQMFFSDAMLEAMFGRDATQHAAPGSYPAYFQAVVERGLARSDATANRWLHHVLLGHWLPDRAPSFLAAPALRPFELVQASLATAPSFADFDLVSLSNVFDWMGDEGIAPVVERLRRECRPGTRVVLRQLNNRAPVEDRFVGFRFDAALAARLHAEDQSLFYERLLVGERTNDR
jgi:S-adenosylmethionine-diacylglycerol 3-amino-3-carboxypropyl transferase